MITKFRFFPPGRERVAKPRNVSNQRTFLERFISGPWPWLLPAILMLLVFRLYPLLSQLYISMTDMRIATINQANFIGLANYEFLLNDRAFISTVLFTFVYTIVGVAGQFIIGFGLALLLNQPMFGRLVYRLAILSAWVISSLIVGYMWRLMLSESSAGVLNAWLAVVGIDRVSWLSDLTTAKISVIGVNIWRSVAFTMVFMLGGLQTVPLEILEAAKVDGANAWQRLMRVIVPYLRPLIGLNLIFVTIATFNVYEQILALTGGGPGSATETVGLSMFKVAFGSSIGTGGLGLLGRGAAIGTVMFIITFIFALIYLRLWIFTKEDD
ncbi:MAG: sugar ABC transporter permease [Anaerolineaceae bacterium]|nr:MAG: sugar ABC transporter permease [Anaerolineaceae bacterium]